MGQMSVSELRAELKKAMARVEAGEILEITRDGKVAAVLLNPSELRRRARSSDAWAAAAKLRREIDEARGKPLSVAGTISKKRADEMIRAIREDRDSS